MSVEIIFRGGLFTALPGGGDARKVDVLMRKPLPVSVMKDSEHLQDLELSLSAAFRVDFEPEGGLDLGDWPIRAISHVVPVNYQGFRKTVSFSNGNVTGVGEDVPPDVEEQLKQIGESGTPQQQAAEYRKFTGTPVCSENEEYHTRLLREFFASANNGTLKRWATGYSIHVVMEGVVSVVLDGQIDGGRAIALPDGVSIQFAMDPGSTIPHFPMDNPHVLEQPPTI